MFFGYYARGNGALDLLNSYTTYPIFDIFNSQPYYISVIGWPLVARIINSPAATPNRTILFDKLPLYGFLSGNVGQFKGRLRWLTVCSVGATLDTFNNKTFLALSNASSLVPSIVIGPYDGVTTPIE